MGGSDADIPGLLDDTRRRGIYMHSLNNSSWGIYAARAGAGRSFSGGTASSLGFTHWAMRFRATKNSNEGFIFENNNDEAVISIRASDGFLRSRYLRDTRNATPSANGDFRPVMTRNSDGGSFAFGDIVQYGTITGEVTKTLVDNLHAMAEIKGHSTYFGTCPWGGTPSTFHITYNEEDGFTVLGNTGRDWTTGGTGTAEDPWTVTSGDLFNGCVDQPQTRFTAQDGQLVYTGITIFARLSRVYIHTW